MRMSLIFLAKKVLGYVRFHSWQAETYVVFRFPDSVGSDPEQEVPAFYRIIGINGCADPGDVVPGGALPSSCEAFVAHGDDGVVVLSGGRAIGWAWVRRGPYIEPSGPGRVGIGAGVEVIRYFEVLPEARGLGIGGLVLCELTRRLHIRGRRNVAALVSAGNDASLAAFSRLGYRRTGRLRAIRSFGHAPVRKLSAHRIFRPLR